VLPRRVIVRGVRRTPIPELFLGLLSIAAAFFGTALVIAHTLDKKNHTRDTISVTGSAHKPISANLVVWSLSVNGSAKTAAVAARRLRVDAKAVTDFLHANGIRSDEIERYVVHSEQIVEQLPKHRRRTHYVVSQGLEVRTRQIDVVEAAATQLGGLIERGIGVAAEPLQYVSTELTKAKLDALVAATAEARHRAEILVKGLGGKLGRMRSSSQGVFQITPRDSTEVSDYGLNDTSSREKDVTAVVDATFAVEH
jgi:hypothetical protein